MHSLRLVLASVTMPLHNTIKRQLRVRPYGLSVALRLYISYAISLMVKIITPGRFTSVGHLIPGKRLLTVSIDGIVARLRPHTGDLGMLAGTGETETIQWFRVSPGEVVVDVGAHIGLYTLVAARSGARVIAIEPVPSNFEILKGNVELNRFSNVNAIPIAISNSKGRRTLYLSGMGDTATSSLEDGWTSKVEHNAARQAIEVPCVSLDDLMVSISLDSLDWLKIDVEGHEVRVLEGGSATLRRTKRLILEVSRGNERSCMAHLTKAGLHVASVERGVETSNWLLVR